MAYGGIITDKEKIARLRKMAHKGVKGIQGGLDKYTKTQDIPKAEFIYDCIEILRNVLVDIEDIAVMNGKYTIDKIIQYIDEANDSLDEIDRSFDLMDDEEVQDVYPSIYDLYDEEINVAYGNIQHFTSIFNKLTKLQKE